MDATAQAAALAHFVEATGADAQTATFLLESAGYDVSIALANFFTDDEARREPKRGSGNEEEEEEEEEDDDEFPEEAEEEEAGEGEGKDDGPDKPLAQRLLDSAEAVERPRAPPREREGVRAFEGAGYSLAGGLIESAPAAALNGADADDELQTRTVRLTFWRDGFT
ncbi:hypothetical protein T492DRAFT_872834, partial [Pavlovales sp. CCMP2436]